jgi:hypothetical protein
MNFGGAVRNTSALLRHNKSGATIRLHCLPRYLEWQRVKLYPLY